jgi:hypothetical protein
MPEIGLFGSGGGASPKTASLPHQSPRSAFADCSPVFNRFRCIITIESSYGKMPLIQHSRITLLINIARRLKQKALNAHSDRSVG